MKNNSLHSVAWIGRVRNGNEWVHFVWYRKTKIIKKNRWDKSHKHIEWTTLKWRAVYNDQLWKKVACGFSLYVYRIPLFCAHTHSTHGVKAWHCDNSTCFLRIRIFSALYLSHALGVCVVNEFRPKYIIHAVFTGRTEFKRFRIKSEQSILFVLQFWYFISYACAFDGFSEFSTLQFWA